MNRQMTIGIIVGAVAVTAVGSWAGYQIADSRNYAEVVSVEPITRTVSVPREECHNQLVTQQKPVKDQHQIAGTVAGAVIGGVLGNQVGGGSGKDIATGVGAVAGGYAGKKVQENIQENNVEQVQRQVCSTAYDQHEEADGYRVAYILNGQRQEIHLDYDPGDKIPLEDGKLAIETNS